MNWTKRLLSRQVTGEQNVYNNVNATFQRKRYVQRLNDYMEITNALWADNDLIALTEKGQVRQSIINNHKQIYIFRYVYKRKYSCSTDLLVQFKLFKNRSQNRSPKWQQRHAITISEIKFTFYIFYLLNSRKRHVFCSAERIFSKVNLWTGRV